MVKEAFKKLPEDKKNTIIINGIAEFSKKSYSEASTDEITKNSRISKGILFHYFGSKKEFYCYCLEQALKRLTTELPEPEVNDFYEIIFSSMEEKFSICRKFSEEMRFVNMAVRETNSQVFRQKNEVLVKYMKKIKEKSAKVMAKAVAALNLKKANTEKITEAFTLYIGVIINRYLELYKEKPDQFFQQSEEIKAEIREYIDFLIYGVVKEKSQ
jgi:TetR/AcrR family transcriptional regulator